MIPIGDDDSDRTRMPIVNYVLIAINILVFVFLQGMGGNEKFTYAFSTVPAEILTGKDIATGVLEPTPIPVYFTLITSMFMHGGIAHTIVGSKRAAVSQQERYSSTLQRVADARTIS